jgi:hypothetical protein
LRSISSCRGVVHSINEGSFWRQALRTPRGYHETDRKGIAVEEKKTEAAKWVRAGGEIFPETRARALHWEIPLRAHLQERDLTHFRRSPKLIFEARISRFE